MAGKGLEAQLAPELIHEEDVQSVYNWVDETPLSRPKKNISRDFADGVLFAEVVNHYFPRLVEMHNYSAANSHSQKMYNWNTLNTKVLKKLGYQIHPQDIEELIKAGPGAIERVLKVLHDKIIQAQNGGLKAARGPSRPSATPSEGGRAASSGDDGGLPDRHRGHEDDRHRGHEDDRRRNPPPRERESQHHGGVPHGHAGAASPAAAAQKYQKEVDAELLVEKEQTIAELREMVVIMSEKIKKLEQLVRIKDSKIDALNQKLQKYGLA